MPHLEVKNLSCSYGHLKVLDGVNLSLEKGQVVSLIGGSGSGKSTLLRVIMGLTKPDNGGIDIEAQAVDYNSPGSIRSAREKIAIVFQQYNLFHNMSVLQNVMVTPLKVQKREEQQVRQEALALLAKVGLQTKSEAIRHNFRADSSNAWPSAEPWRCTRRSSCSTRSPRPSTLNWWAKCWTPFARLPTKA